MNIVTTATQAVRAALILSLLLLVAGCAPTIEHHGTKLIGRGMTLGRTQGTVDGLSPPSGADPMLVESIGDLAEVHDMDILYPGNPEGESVSGR